MQTLPTFKGLRVAACPKASISARTSNVGRQQLAVKASVVAEPATLEVKTIDGGAAGSASLSLKIADPTTGKGLVHRYVVMVRQNARQGNASTLTRGEVAGGGRKPIKQKGMGGARRGSQRTPLRPGGGVTFGPKPRDWSIDMNKKERRLALATAIQSAAPDMIVVEDFASNWEEIKTASLVSKLSALGSNPMEQKTLLVLNNISEKVLLSGRNVEKLAINAANALQVYDVLNASKIVVEKSALAYIQEFYGPRSDDDEE